MSTRAATVTLMRAEDLAEISSSSRTIARALAAGELQRVRPGVFVRGDAVESFTREEHAIVRGRALDTVSQRRPILSHLTAAAAHGLPLWDVGETVPVHVIAPSKRPGATVDTVRHRGELDDDEIVEINGMLCTSLSRTVADVARTAGRTTAACIADAALRQVAFDGHGRYRGAEADTFREAAKEVAGRSAHGVARARGVLGFADGRAHLPGESVSRLHLVELGFAPPRLQAPVAAPGGGWYWVDMALDDVNAFGEVDGKGKYRDELVRQGLTAEEVLDREKQREDWIRGITQRRMARWGIAHIRSAATLGARLAAFGIVAPQSRR